MDNSAVVTLRMSKDLKEQSTQFFKSCGLSMSQGIQLFLRQCLNQNEIPFKVVPAERYNQETELAIQETKDILSGKISAKRYHSVDEAFAMVADGDD